MKLRAIRLKEVGRFSAPVAIEGLSGGLDVLAGPNELGKSTILRAVWSALFAQHTSKKQDIELLRPYGGGAPLVELDFDIGPGSFRLRKQFLAARSAELRNLGTGQVARGADAETELAALIGASGGFALLFAEQGRPLAVPAPVATGGAAVMAAIEREVSSVADGGAVRGLAERVRDELSLLVTAHHGRPTGVYKSALDERERLQRARAEAEKRLVQARLRLDELEAVRGRIAALADADAARERMAAATQAQRVFEEAREAREKFKAAEAAIAACARQHEALGAVLDAFDRRLGELTKLEAGAAEAAPLLAGAEARATDSAGRALDYRQRRDGLAAALAGLERRRKALEAAARLNDIDRRLAAARLAEGERARHGEALAGNTADDKIVDAARRAVAAIATLQARLSAAAPRVSLALLPGAAGKITVDGRVLGDAETLSPTRPVILNIEGVGTITIAPGQSQDVDEDTADLDAQRQQLAALLQRAGVATLEEAETRLLARRHSEAKLAEASAQLNASAPEGLERLQRAQAELAAHVGALGSFDDVSADALAAQGEELAAALAEAEERLAGATRQERQASEELIALRARIAGEAGQIDRLEAELGAPEARASSREAKRAALAGAQDALNAAVREGTAWREKAPADARFAELRSAAETAATACRNADEQLARLRHAEAGIVGELKSDRADDVEARVAELVDACAVIEARCADLQEEAGALQLLAREFEAASERTRDRFARPVIERLAPYLQLVLPQARLDLDETLAPHALQRGDRLEELSRLSGGTQEQLALIVRLAFARLLADNGTPAPLVLDDALAYADDERIRGLFGALELAARSHQVLVLTCRERAFEALGGHRVSLGRWEDARAAA